MESLTGESETNDETTLLDAWVSELGPFRDACFRRRGLLAELF
jgi:hypothetical protein